MELELKKCISDVFKEQISHIDVLKSHEFYNRYTSFYTTRWNYIWVLYQTVISINDIHPNIYPSIIETVYSMALKTQDEVNKNCTGQIFISHENKMKLTEGAEYFDYSTNSKGEFNNFVDEFLNRVDKCQFTSLLIYYDEYKDSYSFITKNSGHANIILIHNDDTDNNIYMALYEPHGTSCDTDGDNFCIRKKRNIDNFLKKLKDNVDEREKGRNIFIESIIELLCYKKPKRTMLLYDRTFISREESIQSIIPENDTTKEGYCVMYSLFWVYLILHCFKISKTKNIKSTLKNVEELVLLYPVEHLEKVITGFAISVYNYYFENVNNMSRENVTFFHKEFERLFNLTWNTEKIGIKSTKRKLAQRKIPNSRRRSKMEEFGAEDEFVLKKYDREICRFDEDCLSHNCKRGICAPYHSEH